MNWDTPIKFVPMVGPVYQKRLLNLDIETLGDLLLHAPRHFEDYTRIVPVNQISLNETCTTIGSVEEIKNIFLRSGKQMQQAVIVDATGRIKCTWFNQPFILNALKKGSEVAISGKVEQFGKDLQLLAPDYELVRTGKPLIHCGRLVPVYPQTEGVSSKWLRSRIAPLIETAIITKDPLPDEVRARNQLLPLAYAVQKLHFPKTLAEHEQARRRLAFDELFIEQLRASLRRREWQTTKLRTALRIDKEQTTDFIEHLPFTLTNAQTKCVQEILADLAKPYAMNRLLQGDVGSGKTVVAAITMYVTFLNKFASILMSPTEILARQHFNTLSAVLSPFGIQVGLQTGSSKSIPKSTKKTENGTFDVLIGTHAVLEKWVQLARVGLIVIDEQHRFGVRQRALLRQKGTLTHTLTMTATPIPRTLALTLYGDLDLSIIDEMPVGRKPVKTWVVPPHKRTAAYRWIEKQITANPNDRVQAFVVCPFIEPSESNTTIKAATAEFKRLTEEIFPHLKLGLLHGAMRALEKDQVLTEFREHTYNILVCTPVVEVGIDIPDATIMLIEGAERFGLAQLHQLRGRVGRADKQSYCLLFPSVPDTEGLTRLRHLEKNNSGLALSELDFQLRGAGTAFGTLQHGQQELKIASGADTELLELTHREAQNLLAGDPELTHHPLLKERVKSSTIVEVTPD